MQSECSDILTELESWYARENGVYLQQQMRSVVRNFLDTSFGYHILQLGVTGGDPLCQESPINHRIYCSGSPGAGVELVADADELPLESDSVDTIIAHHCLEFADDPHQVLREIHRVLTPQGRLLLIGFNPYSFQGINTRVRGLLGNALWSQHRPVGENRMTDWLHLLGCEVLDCVRLYGLPPLGGDRLRRYMIRCDAWSTRHNLPVGGVYILHATKNIAGVNRPRRHFRYSGERLIGLVPKPSRAPAPTPITPLPRRCRPFEKGNVAA